MRHLVGLREECWTCLDHSMHLCLVAGFLVLEVLNLMDPFIGPLFQSFIYVLIARACETQGQSTV